MKVLCKECQKGLRRGVRGGTQRGTIEGEFSEICVVLLMDGFIFQEPFIHQAGEGEYLAVGAPACGHKWETAVPGPPANSLLGMAHIFAYLFPPFEAGAHRLLSMLQGKHWLQE